ncbi:MAG: hypothetical protein JXL20_11015 [Deltaproteobacteria bacterium]|nr:hypothetical protein [Deltaproteobacteria bacterium]
MAAEMAAEMATEMATEHKIQVLAVKKGKSFLKKMLDAARVLFEAVEWGIRTRNEYKAHGTMWLYSYQRTMINGRQKE